MGHGSAAGQSRGRLKITLVLTASYMAAEIIGGLLTGSLALLADAAHMATDVGGLAFALFAIWIGQRPPDARKTFGYYRAEILAAVANGALLFGVAFYILFEAYQRFREPVRVASGAMLAVAAVGLAVNVFGMYLLRAGARESLNVKGAYLEVMGDLLGSVGVLVAAGVIWLTGWNWVDPAFSVLIGLFILPRTWRLLREAVDVLLEAIPAQVELSAVEQALAEPRGVEGVHDLHAWSITSGKNLLTGHVRVAEGVDRDEVLRELRKLLQERFGFDHVTLEIETGTVHPEKLPY